MLRMAKESHRSYLGGRCWICRPSACLRSRCRLRVAYRDHTIAQMHASMVRFVGSRPRRKKSFVVKSSTPIFGRFHPERACEFIVACRPRSDAFRTPQTLPFTRLRDGLRPFSKRFPFSGCAVRLACTPRYGGFNRRCSKYNN